MIIQCYSINECASTGMDHNDEGDYVFFDDHEDALLNAAWELKELQKKYDKLVEKLGSIYKEA